MAKKAKKTVKKDNVLEFPVDVTAVRKLSLVKGDALVVQFPRGLTGDELNQRSAVVRNFLTRNGFGDVPFLVVAGAIVLEVIHRQDVEAFLTDRQARDAAAAAKLPAPQVNGNVMTEGAPSAPR